MKKVKRNVTKKKPTLASDTTLIYSRKDYIEELVQMREMWRKREVERMAIYKKENMELKSRIEQLLVENINLNNTIVGIKEAVEKA